MRDVVIVDNVRTGLAKSFRGSFNLTRSDDMVAHVIDSLLDRNPKVSADEVEDVVLGMAMHEGEQTGNLARLAVMLSKLPVTTAAASINRFCSSGVQAIAYAATQIASGQTEVAMAGGVESISISTNGKSDGDTAIDYPTMGLAGVLPSMMADQVHRAFVIGCS